MNNIVITPRSKSSQKYRANPERYFKVLGQGWYVLMREGVGGPFHTRTEAVVYLAKVLSKKIIADQETAQAAQNF